MASGRKPVWLDEEAHLLIKEYAKLTKTSMTEITSQLVLEHVETLDGGTASDSTPTATSSASAPSESAGASVGAPAAKAVAAAPKAAAKPAPEAPKAKAEKPAEAPKRKRRANTDGVRYLGGIWLV